MKANKLFFLLVTLCSLCLISCNETDDTWDPYYDWQARNAKWFEVIADSARTAMAQAKAQYGDAWEDHCDWRMYKSLRKSQDLNTGLLADSICVHIIQRGTGEVLPNYNDSIRLCFRGWLMDTEYVDDDNVKYSEMSIFSQTYYGAYNDATAAPSKSGIGTFVEGFGTAVQYMVEGDDWYVYIPQELAYGSTASSSIPAYSTLLFRIQLKAIYPVGTTPPDWKVRRR